MLEVRVDIPVGPTFKVFLEAVYVIGFTEGESTEYVPVERRYN